MTKSDLVNAHEGIDKKINDANICPMTFSVNP